VTAIQPRIVVNVDGLGLSHSTVTRDPKSGIVTCSLGGVEARVVLADDPGVLHVLLTDAVAQIEAVSGE
jgi:hypothetical protein